LETKAESNIAEDKEFVEFNVNELLGVPKGMIEELLSKSPVPGKKGFVKISLDKNSAGGYMSGFKKEESRKKLK